MLNSIDAAGQIRHPDGPPATVTGLQAAQVAIAAQVRAWRHQFSPDEWNTLCELTLRMVARERSL